MDRLKQQGKLSKIVKNRFRAFKKTLDGHFVHFGPVHITEKEYGMSNGYSPLTNKYVKKIKKDLKREYRGVKHSEKQQVRKEIEQTLLEN